MYNLNEQFAHLDDFIGSAGLTLLFLLLHLLYGLFARGGRPFLNSIVESAGEEVDRRLNRDTRTPQELFVRGVATALVMIVFGIMIGAAVQKIGVHDFGWAASIVFLFMTVSVMGPLSVLRRVAKHLEANEKEKAAQILQPFVREDLAKADQHTIVRRAMEYSALGLNMYFVAPLLFFMLFKPIGLAIYVMVAGLYEAYGVNDSRHMMFGGVVRGLEKAFDFIPARITAFLMIVAALFVSKSNPVRGFAIAAEQARQYKSANRGLLIAAMAGGLGVTLGGPLRHRRGFAVEHGWIGPAKSTAKVGVPELRRAAMLHFVTFLCALVFLSLFFVVQNYFT